MTRHHNKHRSRSLVRCLAFILYDFTLKMIDRSWPTSNRKMVLPYTPGQLNMVFIIGSSLGSAEGRALSTVISLIGNRLIILTAS